EPEVPFVDPPPEDVHARTMRMALEPKHGRSIGSATAFRVNAPLSAPRPLHPAPAPALLRREARVLSDRERAQLALELAVALEPLARQPAVGERRSDRTARLALVAAVREAAARGQLGDVGERLVERLLAGPELELAHPRRVEQDRAARERDELAVGRRVAAAAVRPQLAGPQAARAE